MLWDYSVLLWVLSELYQENIFNSRVEEIIQRLIEPLTNETNLPKLQSNRLFLALALIKLQQTTNHEPGTTADSPSVVEQSSNIQTFEPSNLETKIDNLLTGIKRNTLKSELPSNNTTLRYGTSGVAWVYQLLYHLSGDSHIIKEMEYWLNQSFTLREENIYSDTGINNGNTFGILEGLSGLLLITEIKKETKDKGF